MHTDYQHIVQGNLEAIDQLAKFINGLSSMEYQFTDSELYESSIGQHLRHVLDLYHALIHPEQPDVIDYDKRRRGLPLESHKEPAMLELAEIHQWLGHLTEQQLGATHTVKTEILLSSSISVTMPSSLARELCFTSSHLIHHLAQMASIAKLAGHSVDNNIGQAPATVSFIRNETKEHEISGQH